MQTYIVVGPRPPAAQSLYPTEIAGPGAPSKTMRYVPAPGAVQR